MGGFSIVLNDGRAAFLTASSLKFDPNVSINNYVVIIIVRMLFSKYKEYGLKAWKMLHAPLSTINID